MPLPVLAIPALLEMGGKLIDRLIPNPEAKAAAALELAKLQESGELARMADSTKLTEAFLADTQSARDREVKISTSSEAPYLNKIITPILALIVTIGGGWILIYIKDADTKMAAVSVVTLVLGYYFGTSQGSTKASQLFRDIARKNSE